MLKPMQRDSSLRERAAVALRASIVTGEIRPGEIYSAPMIAQQLGVSATPVREAMLDLASEGLVEPVRNRGFRVIQLTERDLDEIFQVRLLLEVPPVVAVAGDKTLLSDKLVRRLNRLIEVLEASAAASDFGGLIDADIRFHSELLALSGNERLVELVARLRAQTLRYGLPRLERDVLISTATDHVRLLEAVLEGDKENVRRVMEEHLAMNRGLLAWRDDEIQDSSGQADVATAT